MQFISSPPHCPIHAHIYTGNSCPVSCVLKGLPLSSLHCYSKLITPPAFILSSNTLHSLSPKDFLEEGCGHPGYSSPTHHHSPSPAFILADSMPILISHLKFEPCLLFHSENEDPLENSPYLPYLAISLSVLLVSILSSSPPVSVKETSLMKHTLQPVLYIPSPPSCLFQDRLQSSSPSTIL